MHRGACRTDSDMVCEATSWYDIPVRFVSGTVIYLPYVPDASAHENGPGDRGGNPKPHSTKVPEWRFNGFEQTERIVTWIFGRGIQ